MGLYYVFRKIKDAEWLISCMDLHLFLYMQISGFIMTWLILLSSFCLFAPLFIVSNSEFSYVHHSVYLLYPLRTTFVLLMLK